MQVIGAKGQTGYECMKKYKDECIGLMEAASLDPYLYTFVHVYACTPIQYWHNISIFSSILFGITVWILHFVTSMGMNFIDWLFHLTHISLNWKSDFEMN